MADQGGGKRKREKSPVIETSEALAMQNISVLVQAMESEAWGQTSKSQKIEDTLESLDLTTSSSAIEVYQAPSLAIVPVVNSQGAVEATKDYPIDLSVEGLRKLVDFPVQGDCTRIVPPSIVEKAFLHRCGQKYTKDAWKQIAPWFGLRQSNAQARNEGLEDTCEKECSLLQYHSGAIGGSSRRPNLATPSSRLAHVCFKRDSQELESRQV
ncbi:hypothetical protein R1sor_024304 [Riccia sorocarpa]|uniref:Uncharacterized protein n=1 Tax=Riccia sorocarpa TaxID=122646 RepID=A0ABD3GQ55_9MARC